MAPIRPRPPKSVPQRCLGFLSSFGLATALFVLLAVLVLFGTLAQVDMDIHDVKQKYFSSACVVHHFYSEGVDGEILKSKLGIPLIGGYPLMALLFVNILVGGLIRIRKKPQTIGVVISHFSMLILLAWGFVTNHFVDEGFAQIYEGEEVNYFMDYTKWDVELVKETGEGAREVAYVIAHEDIEELTNPESRRVFDNAAWPFEITVSRYARNAIIGTANMAEEDAKVVGGYAVIPQDPSMSAERNIPAAYVEVNARGKGIGEGILWGLARQPLTITDPSGDKWWLNYRKRIYDLPFTVRLREFFKEDHPGVAMARRYMSDVTKIDGEVKDDVRIRMNHPLNAGQYTFYQSGFGPSANDPPGTPVYTVLAVWKRPLMAGQWPLFACITVVIGLLVHFIMKLIQHFDREALRASREARKQRENPAETAS